MKKRLLSLILPAVLILSSGAARFPLGPDGAVSSAENNGSGYGADASLTMEGSPEKLSAGGAPYNQAATGKENSTPAVSGVPQNPWPSAEQVNVTQEITLTSAVTYQTPYTECAVNAVFTGPNGQKMTVAGFWDGGQLWRIRFAAPAAGAWTYVTACTNQSDSGLHGKTGSLKASAYTGDNVLIERGRLRVSDDKSYLTYKDGTPFFWLADYSPFIFSRARLNFSNRPDEYDSMFKGIIDKRAKEGYTAYEGCIWLNNTSESIDFGANEGGPQWLGGAVWKDLNPAFWQNLDERVQYIVSKGIVPVIFFGWSGAVNQGNLEDFKKTVRYAVARLSSYPVMWCMGGEYNNNNGTVQTNPDNYGRLGEYLRQTDPYSNIRALHGVFGMDQVRDAGKKAGDLRIQYPVDYLRGQEWLDLILNEGGHVNNFDYPNYTDWELYNKRDYKTVWLEAEAKFEDIWEIPTNQTREIAYLAFMNGSAGYTYGAEGLWQMTWNSQDMFQTYGRAPTPWWVALSKPVGSVQMPYLKKVFTSLPWWQMKPANGIVEWGYDREAQLTVCQPSATATPSRDWIAVYYPINSRSINTRTYPDRTHVLTGLVSGRTYSAWWYDCQTGAYTEISTSVKADAAGKYALPRPSSPESKDWMLILRDNAALDIGQLLYQAAKAERNNTALPRVIGETALPSVSYNPNTQVFNLSPVQDEQGKNGFRYYAYNPVTEVYSELIRSDIAKQFGWGDWVWWMPHMNEGFVTDNKICAGPVNNAAVVWTAPANGTVLIQSRPIWMDQWVNGKGATFSIWHNDAVLTEFRFNGTSYNSDSYMKTISVKAGDRIQIMAARNQLEPWAPQSAQLETNTDLYFTPSN